MRATVLFDKPVAWGADRTVQWVPANGFVSRTVRRRLATVARQRACRTKWPDCVRENFWLIVAHLGLTMRRSSERVADSAEKTVRDIRRATRRRHRPRIRFVLFLKAYAVRSALPSCAARKASIRTCITGGPRSSWRQARSGSRAIRRVKRLRTRSRTSGLRPASSRRRWPKS